MSAPIKNQIQGYIMKLDDLAAKPLPALPGATATPNKLTREYYWAKKFYEDLESLEIKLLEADTAANDYITKTAAGNRDAVSNAYTDWINQLQVPAKRIELLQAKSRWEARVQILADRLDLPDASSSSSTTASNPVSRIRKPQVKLKQNEEPAKKRSRPEIISPFVGYQEGQPNAQEAGTSQSTAAVHSGSTEIKLPSKKVKIEQLLPNLNCAEMLKEVRTLIKGAVQDIDDRVLNYTAKAKETPNKITFKIREFGLFQELIEEKWPQYKTYMTGSTYAGLSSGKSDLDVVIYQGEIIIKDKIVRDLEDLRRMMRQNGYDFITASIRRKNCFLSEVTLFGRPGTQEIKSPLEDVTNCNYDDGHCLLENNAILMWPVSSAKDDEKKYCTYKKKGTLNGTFSNLVWMSNDFQRSLIFDREAREIRICGRDLRVSFSGLAIPETQFQYMLNNPVSRKRRTLDNDNPIDETEFLSHLEASAVYQNQALKKTFKALVQLMCNSRDKSISFSSVDPTEFIRTKFQSELFEAKWISKNAIQYWPCSLVNFTFIPTIDGKCYQHPSINFTIDETEIFSGFLEPKNKIVLERSKTVPCAEAQWIIIEFGKKFVKINQLSGEVTIVNDVESLEIQFEKWDKKLPDLALQIFRKSALFNLSNHHIDMFEMLEAFKAARTIDTRPMSEKNNWGSNQKMISFGSLFSSITFGNVSDWITKLISTIVLIKWIYEIWIWRQKRIIRTEIRKTQFKQLVVKEPAVPMLEGPKMLMEPKKEVTTQMPMPTRKEGPAMMMPIKLEV